MSGDIDLKKACEIVERACRSVGKDCQITFMVEGVEVAPTSWPGSETGDDFYTTLRQAMEYSDHS